MLRLLMLLVWRRPADQQGLFLLSLGVRMLYRRPANHWVLPLLLPLLPLGPLWHEHQQRHLMGQLMVLIVEAVSVPDCRAPPDVV